MRKHFTKSYADNRSTIRFYFLSIFANCLRMMTASLFCTCDKIAHKSVKLMIRRRISEKFEMSRGIFPCLFIIPSMMDYFQFHRSWKNRVNHTHRQENVYDGWNRNQPDSIEINRKIIYASHPQSIYVRDPQHAHRHPHRKDISSSFLFRPTSFSSHSYASV